MKRAALYCRVSTIDQHPETQLGELRQFASNKGFQVVGEYRPRLLRRSRKATRA